MTACDDFIEKVKRELPELCTTKDLVRLGIYKSPQAASHARKMGFSSPYFKLPTGTVVHPKAGIIQLLTNAKNEARGIREDNYTGRSYPKGESSDNQKGVRI